MQYFLRKDKTLWILLISPYSCSNQLSSKGYYLSNENLSFKKTYKFQCTTDSEKLEFWEISKRNKVE